jgi:hypothetical protein
MSEGPGKGNRRRGPVRGMKSGKRRGTMPAHRDPIIIGRRALAAPLWLAGNDGATVQNQVNTWLQDQGELPVSIETIRGDKRAIEAQWREDGADTISEARATHIARLERLMSRLWVLFDRAEAEGMNCVPLADQIRKLESDIGSFDSSLAAARVHVTNDETAIDRFFASLAIPLPPDALQVIPLLADEFGTYRELPAPIRGDG